MLKEKTTCICDYFPCNPSSQSRNDSLGAVFGLCRCLLEGWGPSQEGHSESIPVLGNNSEWSLVPTQTPQLSQGAPRLCPGPRSPLSVRETSAPCLGAEPECAEASGGCLPSFHPDTRPPSVGASGRKCGSSPAAWPRLCPCPPSLPAPMVEDSEHPSGPASYAPGLTPSFPTSIELHSNTCDCSLRELCPPCDAHLLGHSSK